MELALVAEHLLAVVKQATATCGGYLTARPNTQRSGCSRSSTGLAALGSPHSARRCRHRAASSTFTEARVASVQFQALGFDLGDIAGSAGVLVAIGWVQLGVVLRRRPAPPADSRELVVGLAFQNQRLVGQGGLEADQRGGALGPGVVLLSPLVIWAMPAFSPYWAEKWVVRSSLTL